MAKVEITIAGHSVAVEADEPAADLAALAQALLERTAVYAARTPVGFSTVSAQVERAEPYTVDGLD